MMSMSGDIETVWLLLHRGADMNIRGFPNPMPPQMVTINRRHEVAELLLQFGTQQE